MALTILIGRRYNTSTDEVIQIANDINVVSQHQESSIANSWYMTDDEVSQAKKNLPWFSALFEHTCTVVPLSIPLYLNIHLNEYILQNVENSPPVEGFEDFTRWFTFWCKYGLRYANPRIQFC